MLFITSEHTLVAESSSAKLIPPPLFTMKTPAHLPLNSADTAAFIESNWLNHMYTLYCASSTDETLLKTLFPAYEKIAKVITLSWDTLRHQFLTSALLSQEDLNPVSSIIDIISCAST